MVPAPSPVSASVIFPFPGIVGGVWVFLAHLLWVLIFSGECEGEVTGVAGNGNGDAEGASEGGKNLKGCGFFS